MSNYRINTYTSPVSSEIIFKDSEVITQTNVFINSNGEIYSGPVHFHDGVYMEGSYHTSESHGVLRQRTVTDSKIKDYREPDSLFTPNRRALNMINRTKLLDGPWISHNDDGDLYGMFNINTKKLLATKTLYGSKLAKLSPFVFDRLLESFNFRSLSLYQEKIQPIVTSRRGTPRLSRKKLLRKKFLIHTRDAQNILRSRTYKGTTIKEHRISDKIEDRTIVFKQNYSNSFKGVYKYGLLIQFIDPTYQFVQNFITELKQSILIIKPYVVRSRRNSSVIKDTQRFTQKFVETEMSRYPSQELAPWSNSIKNYVDLFSALKGMTKEEAEDLQKRYAVSVYDFERECDL